MSNVKSPKYKTIRHYHQAGDCHELTFSCFQRLPLLIADPVRHFLAESIDKALDRHNTNLSAFVFMPEHVHLLVWPANPCHAEISSFLKTLKQSCSTKVKHWLKKNDAKLLDRLMVRERPGKITFRFWQEGPGYDRNLQSGATVKHSIDYIHSNPVKRRLVVSAIDWIWSSARHYMPNAYPRPLSSPRLTNVPAEFLNSRHPL